MHARHAKDIRRGRDRHRPRGFGLIELLVAMAIFVAAVLAGLPLLIRGLLDVRTGGELSAAVSHARSRVEETALRRTLDGATPEPTVEYFSHRLRRWLPSPPESPDRSLWERRATVRSYPLAALADGVLEEDEALTGESEGAAFAAVEVEVLRPAGRRAPEVRLRRLLMLSQLPESPAEPGPEPG